MAPTLTDSELNHSDSFNQISEVILTPRSSDDVNSKNIDNHNTTPVKPPRPLSSPSSGDYNNRFNNIHTTPVKPPKPLSLISSLSPSRTSPSAISNKVFFAEPVYITPIKPPRTLELHSLHIDSTTNTICHPQKPPKPSSRPTSLQSTPVKLTVSEKSLTQTANTFTFIPNITISTLPISF